MAVDRGRGGIGGISVGGILVIIGIIVLIVWLRAGAVVLGATTFTGGRR